MKLILICIFTSLAAVAQFPSPSALALLGDKISEYRLNKKNDLRYKDVKVLEYLLYKGDHLREKIQRNDKFSKRFSINLKMEADKSEGRVSYLLGKQKLLIHIRENAGRLDFQVIQKGKMIEHGRLAAGELSEDYIDALRKGLYALTLRSRGMDDFQPDYNVALEADHSKLSEDKSRGLTLRIKEGLFNNENDNTNWEYLPVKLVAYPVQKIMYDVPNMATSLVVESVSRSPVHNIQGAGDEFRGAGLGIWNGLKDLVRGIFNPKKATAFDGLFQLGDAGIRAVKGGLGVVKSAVSIVGYPIFRLAGGKKSKRVPLRGKRAAIVIVDTGMGGYSAVGNVVDGVFDTYGEQIVRGNLKSISRYYCVESNAEPNSLYDCIDNMPEDIQYVDFFALTHTGGDSSMERWAKYAAEKKGVKPELMVSIGCYDNPSSMTEKENSVGQEKTSWAVHYYLSNLITKRLRGIPMDVAANEAFIEGMPSNIINPISLGAYGAVSLMEGDLKLGYHGSKPDLYSDEAIVSDLVSGAWSGLGYKLRDFRWKYIIAKSSDEENSVDSSKVKEAISKIQKVNAYLQERADRIPEGSQELLQASIDQMRMLGIDQDSDSVAIFEASEGAREAGGSGGLISSYF